MTKYVFVTGGVVSGLGKGITAASLGRLLKSRGLKVAAQKLDPYINVDPGTMSPYQHGEVYVTEDGSETDLDLGLYQRGSEPLFQPHHRQGLLERTEQGAARRHAGYACNAHAEIRWIDSETITDGTVAEALAGCDGIIVPGRLYRGGGGAKREAFLSRRAVSSEIQEPPQPSAPVVCWAHICISGGLMYGQNPDPGFWRPV